MTEFVGALEQTDRMTLAIAILGLLTAGFSAWAAWKSARAAEAANNASREMTAIEAARRQQELTPELNVRIEPYGGNDRCFHLYVGLVGPIALRRVSSVAVTIRDDRPGRGSSEFSFAGQTATNAQIRAQIWGPLRLTPHLHCGSGVVDEFGRSITIPDVLEVGEVHHLQLELTQLPPWTTATTDPQKWWDETVGDLVRLSIEVVGPSGDGDWMLSREISISEMRRIDARRL